MGDVTLDYVRAVYGVKDGHVSGERLAEFDVWLARHDRRVKAEAWDEGYRSCFEESFAPNPYREESK